MPKREPPRTDTLPGSGEEIKSGFVPPGSQAAAAFGRQVDHANARFGGCEVCHGCRRKLKSGEATLIGRDRRGRMMVMAAGCCEGRLVVLVGFGLYLAAADAPAAWLAEVPARGTA